MVHAAVLPSAQVFFWNTNYNSNATPTAYLWDPTSTYNFAGLTVPDQNPRDAASDANNIFCAGLAFLPGGRLLIGGGQTNIGVSFGNPYTNLFDPTGNGGTGYWWNGYAPKMNFGRWYPTLTPLGNGAMVIQTGTDSNGNYVATPELWQPDGNGSGVWVALSNVANVPTPKTLPYYPWIFTDPVPGREGWVSYAGPGTDGDALDTSGRGNWTQTGPDRNNNRMDAPVYPINS